MSLLTPDSGLVFWMLLSFGIVVGILCKYGFPVILQAVETRKNYIAQSLEAAREAQVQREQLQATEAALLAQAKEQRPKRLAVGLHLSHVAGRSAGCRMGVHFDRAGS